MTNNIKSPNFQFLKDFDSTIYKTVLYAEKYCLDDPSTSLIKLRIFGEYFAKLIAARLGVYVEGKSEFLQILKELKYESIIVNFIDSAANIGVNKFKQ